MSKEIRLKILVAGGGTGGHIYPGLAVIQAFEADQVLYVGSRRGLEKKLTQSHGIRFSPITARPLMGQGFFGKLFGLAALGMGFFQSLWIVSRFKPNIVLGTGGYVCSPVLLGAAFLRIPSLLLEQNLLPGRTTRFLSRFVSRVLVSFPESVHYLPGARVEVTGNPVRPEIGTLTKEEGCRKLGIPSNEPVITLMGASQGARVLNDILMGALPALSQKPWQILHLTGQSHYPQITETARQLLGSASRLRYRSFPFVEDMAAIYAASDLIVSRAGATSLAEIMHAGKASVLVPYPFAADNHQELNARWLEQKNGCQVILEKEFSSQQLTGLLEEMFRNPDSVRRIGENAHRAARGDALARIVQLVQDVAR